MSTFSPELLGQYQSLRERAGYFLLPGRTLIEVTGSDRASFLHSFCTNDVKRLTAGQGCEAFVTSHQGKTLGHILIFCHEDSLVLESTPGQAAPLVEHFNRFVISEDVEFHDRSAERAELLLAGPEAAGMLGDLTAIQPPQSMLGHATVMLGALAIVWRRAPFIDGPCWLLETSADDQPKLVAALEERGAVCGGNDVLEAARLECGWPWYGIDITDDNLPQEINRNEQAISFKKGCYLGQETVARLDALGHVNRLLVRLAFAGSEVPAAGLPVLADEKTVGGITSAAWSPSQSKPIAFAMIRRPHARSTSQVTTAIGDAEVL